MRICRTTGLVFALLCFGYLTSQALTLDLASAGLDIDQYYSSTFDVGSYIKSTYGEDANVRIGSASMQFTFSPSIEYISGDPDFNLSYMSNGEWITDIRVMRTNRMEIADCTVLGKTGYAIQSYGDTTRTTTTGKTFVGWRADNVPMYEILTITNINYGPAYAQIVFDETMLYTLNTTGLLSYSIVCGDPYFEQFPKNMHLRSAVFSADVSNVPPVPEPSSLLLLGTGLLGFLRMKRSRAK